MANWLWDGNVELRTLNGRQERTFDLEDRLLEYAALIIQLVEKLPNTRAGNHLAGQLLTFRHRSSKLSAV